MKGGEGRGTATKVSLIALTGNPHFLGAACHHQPFPTRTQTDGPCICEGELPSWFSFPEEDFTNIAVRVPPPAAATPHRVCSTRVRKRRSSPPCTNFRALPLSCARLSPKKGGRTLCQLPSINCAPTLVLHTCTYSRHRGEGSSSPPRPSSERCAVCPPRIFDRQNRLRVSSSLPI